MKFKLQFAENRCFKIVQFTDIHWHNGEPADRQSEALMVEIVSAEKPNLVVLTGDILAGGGCHDACVSLRQVIQIMEHCGVPWTAVFGNHDDEGTANRDELMEIMMESTNALVQPGPAEVPGVGNYVLTVASAEGDTPAALLYFIDSGSYAPTDIGGYAWIQPEQIAWYLRESAMFRTTAGQPLPALAFFHIPLPEYEEIWNKYTCYGVKYEDVCAPSVNSGFFAAMHNAGDVLGTFVGHDHINDFCGTLHGIRLCYGRATGYNTYGRADFPRGARVIQLCEGTRQFETWLHLENQSLVYQQPKHQPN